MRAFAAGAAAVLLTFPTVSAQSVPQWSLVPTLRIGAVEGPNALDVVGSVVISAKSGNIYIAERSQTITAFDGDGRRIRSFGGQGDGPGEFRNLSDIYWSDGFVVAVDRPAARVTRFTENGEVVDSRVVESRALPGSTGTARVFAPLTGNDFLGSVDIEVQAGQVFGTDAQLVRMNGEGDHVVLDRLIGVFRTVKLPDMYVPVPMVPGPRYAVHPQGSAIAIVHQKEPTSATTSEFRVRKLGGDGKVHFARSYTYTPRRLPAGFIGETVARGQRTLARVGRSAPPNLERILTDHTPGFVPPVSEVHVGADGSIWLRREMIPGTDDPVTWWVLNERGDHVAQLRLPGRFQLRHFDRDTVWGIERDELDVNYVIRYRIQR